MDKGRSDPAKAAARAVAACEAVSVTTTARLHFGFLDPSGRGPQPFGSFGLCIDRPATRLSLRRSQTSRVRGKESKRAADYLERLAATCGVAGAYDLAIAEAITPHAGLGSGTQLALAVGTALATLEDLTLAPQEIAARLGRGSRSGIGIATFESGGAVLDAGPGDGPVPPLLRRIAFPPAWRVILIFDSRSTGMHGPNETAAFAKLSAFPEVATEDLTRRILLGAFPAIEARDFNRFAKEVGYLQDQMGAYYSDWQGGPYVSKGVAKALDWLKSQGLTGLGQSSWGPTGFAFVATEVDGQLLVKGLQNRAELRGLEFALAEGRNEGALINKVR